VKAFGVGQKQCRDIGYEFPVLGLCFRSEWPYRIAGIAQVADADGALGLD
jgi:hypothetical protein